MNAYTLFKTIHECGQNAQYVDVVNALRAKGFDATTAHLHLKNLLNDGYIEGELGAYKTVSFTPKGYARLQELEDLQEQSRKVVSEKKKNNIFQVMLVLLGGIITHLVAHLPSIIDFLSSLFH